MRFLLWLLAIAIVSIGLGAQEERKIPKGSLQVMAVGCVNDRILTTTRTPKAVGDDEQDEDVDVPVGRFQITGKKSILTDVKKYEREGKQVEVVGLLRKADLKEPGIPVPGGRVVISPGRGGDRYGRPVPPAQRVVLLEVSSVKPLEIACHR